MRGKKNQFEYLKLGNNIVCRYPISSDNQTYSAIGEVYDSNTKKWVRRSSTMRYRMGGEGKTITESEVYDWINDILKKTKMRK